MPSGKNPAISAISAGSRRKVEARINSSTWAGRRAPTIAPVTAGWRIAQAIATTAADTPWPSPTRRKQSTRAKLRLSLGSWKSALRVLRQSSSGIRDAACAVASVLAEVARHLVREGLVDGLVATGGDTALAAAQALGAQGMHLWGEVEPGVPLGRLAGPHPLPIVTKAGGFGDPGMLLGLCAALRGLALPTQNERLPA